MSAQKIGLITIRNDVMDVTRNVPQSDAIHDVAYCFRQKIRLRAQQADVIKVTRVVPRSDVTHDVAYFLVEMLYQFTTRTLEYRDCLS